MKQNTPRPAAILLAAFSLMLGSTAQAQVSLADRAQLVKALSAKPPCCVIDGRAAGSRKRDPLANALPWRANLKINPTTTVVVVADRDQDALDIARALGREHPGKPILVAKGGVATWTGAKMLLLMEAKADASMSSSASFVIPANTCEQGKPLQELRTNKK